MTTGSGRLVVSLGAATLLHLALLPLLGFALGGERDVDAAGAPILNEVQADLVALRTTLTTVQSAARQIEGAAAQVKEAADQVGVLANSADSEMFKNVSRATRELASAARAVHDLTEKESPTTQHLDAALQEVTRAARALRLLSETLEQQPEAILRGKRSETTK